MRKTNLRKSPCFVACNTNFAITVKPAPTSRIPYKSAAPFSHRLMRPGPSRYHELYHGMNIEDARTDYEVKYILRAAHAANPNPNMLLEGTVVRQLADHPAPKA